MVYLDQNRLSGRPQPDAWPHTAFTGPASQLMIQGAVFQIHDVFHTNTNSEVFLFSFFFGMATLGSQTLHFSILLEDNWLFSFIVSSSHVSRSI